MRSFFIGVTLLSSLFLSVPTHSSPIVSPVTEPAVTIITQAELEALERGELVRLATINLDQLRSETMCSATQPNIIRRLLTEAKMPLTTIGTTDKELLKLEARALRMHAVKFLRLAKTQPLSVDIEIIRRSLREANALDFQASVLPD